MCRQGHEPDAIAWVAEISNEEATNRNFRPWLPRFNVLQALQFIQLAPIDRGVYGLGKIRILGLLFRVNQCR